MEDRDMNSGREIDFKEATAGASNGVSQFFFDKKEKESKQVDLPAEQDKAAELVKTVLHAGIVHKVQNDESVREKVLSTADKVISTRLDVEKNNAEKADKRAYFEANEDACTYFGYDEKTTAKSHVKMMRAWSWVFNALYIITIGFFVVAPIVFFVSKLRVAVEKSWVVILLSVLIYLAVVLSPFILTWLGGV